jgi:hypothetical protein
MYELRIDPTHPDKCGGLKLLGNFCLGLASPMLIGSAFFITNDILVLRAAGFSLLGLGDYAILVVTSGIALLYALPITISAIILPVQVIHVKMVSTCETENENHALKRNSLQKKIRVLLDNNQLQGAKDAKEQMDLMESLYSPCPTWPFNVKMQLFSGVLVSILTTMVPILLHLIFHIQ